LPILTLMHDAREHRVPFVPGKSLRNILDDTDFRVRSGCRGVGACGLCRVRIKAGAVGEPTQNERIHLDAAELSKGIRLACQIMPEDDLVIEILSPAPKSVWRRLDNSAQGPIEGFLPFPMSHLPNNVSRPYGVAVDLGTTHINLSLHDLFSGHWLAGRYGLNPQMDLGSDVVTRLLAAAESTEQAGILSRKAVEGIGGALWDIASREGIDLTSVTRLVLVGNTAMLALLSGQNHSLLLQPSYWMSAIDCLPGDTRMWADAWHIHPQAKIEVLPPLAGFVGSDLLAGVLTTHLTEEAAGGLFVDFGTNSNRFLGWKGFVGHFGGGGPCL